MNALIRKGEPMKRYEKRMIMHRKACPGKGGMPLWKSFMPFC